MASAPSPVHLLLDWHLNLTVTVLLGLAAGLYGWGMRTVKRRHPNRPWPWSRAGSYFAGLATVAVAVLSSIGRYGTAHSS